MKKYKLFTILILVTMLMASQKGKKKTDLEYDGNGRLILPSKEIIEQLPKDGGEIFNRLIFESSPYLLQHSANPVEWYPWSEEAFLEAERRDVPIFLSIGYSTCHWCHVMEHESFEDKEVAKLMNESFVNIKVDREERPDIDKLYMDVTQMVTGRGGWPMTIIMTPQREPFFAGTYFPKHSRYKRQGMMELIPQLKSVWDTDRSDILSDAKSLTNRLKDSYITSKNKDVVNNNILQSAFNQFSSKFDSEWGGFGKAPKFPKAHDYIYLLRYWKESKNPTALKMVEKSLKEMRKGGMYDHIGFGFHRYSTDKEWLAPHFEKMLYDQAILIMAYSEAWRATGKIEYRNVVEEIISYVIRDMTAENGGFYSAEDADSEGEEGLFYLWTTEEIETLLGSEEGKQFNALFNLKSDGNWVEGKRHGQTNILHFRLNLQQVSNNLNIDQTQLMSSLEIWREHLFAIREYRVHPQKDDKILTDWNGLMISALAYAGRALNDKSYIEYAERAMEFILSDMKNEDGSLKKRYRKGESGLSAVLDDYAFVVWGLIELYQSNYNLKYLDEAIALSDYQINHFWDDVGNGFYFSADNGESLLARPKEYYDGAIPAGNSVSAYNYLRLGRILSNSNYEELSYQIIESNAKSLNRYPSGYSMLLQAISFSNSSNEVIIFEGRNEVKNKEMLNGIIDIYKPNMIVILITKENFSIMKEKMAYLNYFPENQNDEPMVYVCENYTCKLPTSNLEKVIQLLTDD
jgi:uncharacterized protein